MLASNDLMENPIWMLVPWAVFAVALGIKAWRFAAVLRRLGGHQMFDTELARDGGGDKTVGGGHHRTQIGSMTRDKRARSLTHHRHDLRLHVAAMPCVELATRMACQRELMRQPLISKSSFGQSG